MSTNSKRSGRFFFIAACVVVVILAAGAVLWVNGALIFAVSRLGGVGISYSKLYPDLPGRMGMNDIRIEDRRNGLGLYAKKGVVRWSPGRLLRGGLEVSFDLSDAHFENLAQGARSSGDAFSQLMLIPFQDTHNYPCLTGNAVIDRKSISIRDFAALGKDIKVFIKGQFDFERTIDLAVKIYLSKGLVAQLPGEFQEILNATEDGWCTLSVGVKGDRSSPSIQITAAQLSSGSVKLRIKAKE